MKKRLRKKIEKRKQFLYNFFSTMYSVVDEKVNAGYVHWIRGYDDGEDYCYDCIKEIYNNLKVDNEEEKEELYSIECSENPETDSLSWCEDCGCPLMCVPLLYHDEYVHDYGRIKTWYSIFVLCSCEIDINKYWKSIKISPYFLHIFRQMQKANKKARNEKIKKWRLFKKRGEK